MKGYSIGLYEKALPAEMPWWQKLRTAKEAGYDYLEMSIDESDSRLARLDWNDTDIDALLQDCERENLPIRSMCLSGHRKYPMGSAARAEKSMDIMRKAICLADRMGIRIIQLAGYDVYYETGSAETRERFLENLKKAADMAASRGIMLGFETMETPFMDTVWKSMFYVQAVDSPWLGVHPDTGNLTNAALLYGTDVLEDLKSGQGHLCALHLKETIPGHYREIPFGTGHVDFEAMIGCAWDLGIRRFVTELWDTGTGDWKAAVDEACRMMTGILDRKEAGSKGLHGPEDTAAQGG
ncbi:L-ribulose-5-phosphate 3-epimerase [uncultured Faecalibaculum sp.]|uniref:L-ribulose-5-phosphate 3-epimerase n=1 Tax=uncultured Faecalibaculum sp. TaxID=1729681 RepID=UPI002626E6B3|nr:L-ribulose-5-phosphate 3-epimerase [uncultured Faecalibaculum sp.]